MPARSIPRRALKAALGLLLVVLTGMIAAGPAGGPPPVGDATNPLSYPVRLDLPADVPTVSIVDDFDKPGDKVTLNGRVSRWIRLAASDWHRGHFDGWQLALMRESQRLRHHPERVSDPPEGGGGQTNGLGTEFYDRGVRDGRRAVEETVHRLSRTCDAAQILALIDAALLPELAERYHEETARQYGFGGDEVRLPGDDWPFKGDSGEDPPSDAGRGFF